MKERVETLDVIKIIKVMIWFILNNIKNKI